MVKPNLSRDGGPYLTFEASHQMLIQLLRSWVDLLASTSKAASRVGLQLPLLTSPSPVASSILRRKGFCVKFPQPDRLRGQRWQLEALRERPLAASCM